MPAAFNRRRWSNPKPTVSRRLIALATGLIRFSPLVPLTNTALAAFYIVLGGGGWIRTTEARASDLQSDPFGHSGTPPEGRTFSRCQGRVSTLNFTLKIPLYACVCPRFEKCVRAVVIFALVSPRRLGSTGSPIESLLRCWNMTQTRASRDYARRQISICIGKKMELARGIEPPTG